MDQRMSKDKYYLNIADAIWDVWLWIITGN